MQEAKASFLDVARKNGAGTAHSRAGIGPPGASRSLGDVERPPQQRIAALAARYAALAGSRKVEFLDLAWPQVDLEAGVVRVRRAKQRGRKRGEVVDAIELSPALREIFAELAATRPEECLHVFPTRDRNTYSARGFKTLWQRLMMAAMAEAVLERTSASRSMICAPITPLSTSASEARCRTCI